MKQRTFLQEQVKGIIEFGVIIAILYTVGNLIETFLKYLISKLHLKINIHIRKYLFHDVFIWTFPVIVILASLYLLLL